MAPKDIAQNLHGLSAIAGAGDAHGVDIAKMGALGCEIGRLPELAQRILMAASPHEPKAERILSRRGRRPRGSVRRTGSASASRPHAIAFAGAFSPWQNLNFLPLPHGQG